MALELNAIVTARIEVAAGLIILRVAPDGWELPEWRSGQFAVLGLPNTAPRTRLSDPDPEGYDLSKPKMIRRAYSISSASQERNYLEFYITLVRSGELTPRLFDLMPGDPIFLGKKISGMFTLESVPPGSDLVLIGTGTGLAPYMSMLRSEIDGSTEARLAVLLGARHSWDLGYRGELISLQRYCKTFHYFPIISRPDEELVPWTGKTGYVQDLWTGGVIGEAWGQVPGPDTTHVLLCGNPGMIEGMLKVLAEEGFTEHSKDQPGNIHVEKYW